MSLKDKAFEELDDYPNYLIGRCGRIYSKYKKGFLSPAKSHRGYELVHITKNKKSMTVSVHRLVAKAFVPNSENKTDVNHKNGIKDDNRAVNLEWVTKNENARHAFKTGLNRSTITGEDNLKAKLDESLVREIRSLLANGETVKEVANKYPVSSSTIYRIKERKIWKHV